MTERCGGVGSDRTERYSREALSSEPSREAVEKKKQEWKQESSQSAADARRDQWIAGMSRDAASMPMHPPACEGPTAEDRARAAADQRSREMHIASAGHTKKTDLPLEDDCIGNAIPGLVAGGITGGARALAAHGIRHAAVDVAKHTGEHVVADLIKHGAEHGAHAVGEQLHHANDPNMPPAPSATASSAVSVPASGAAAASAGRSGPRAVSEPVDAAGGKSEAAPPAGRDAIPYRSGHAPVRIPEALGPANVVVQG